MKYKLAIFDLDGTILNTLDDLTDSTNYALRTNALPERTQNEVRKFVGNGIYRLLERAVPEGTPKELVDKVFITFTEYYKDHCKDKTCAYDGIHELLQMLRDKGMKIAVVSNKADYAVQILCQDYFPGLFDFTVGEKEGIRRKPYPDSVLAVLNQFHMNRTEAVYIGDSEVDYETSKNAGLDVIMVGYGFRDEKFLREQGASIVIHKPLDMMDYV